VIKVTDRSSAAVIPQTVGTTDAEPHIKISRLTKKFGDKVVLKGIDLNVRRGELLVLLGPSGCGKTTTMRSLAGLETPTEGRISINERMVYDGAARINVAPHERNIGMVFQSYAIWPHRTVWQNVAFPLKMKRPRVSAQDIKARVSAVLELVGLEHLATQSASKLSGGQMQRVALARSSVMEPEVLLLDEPLSNLDAKLRERLRVELKQIQRNLGATSIYVTHDQSEALALADRIILMRDGMIEQEGTPLDLYHNPQTRFAAEFIGLNNKLVGHARPSGGGCVLEVPSGFEAWSASPLPTAGEVTAFIRAEDFRISVSEPGAESTSKGSVLRGTVELVELLGSQLLYAVRVGEILLQVLTGNEGEMIPHGTRVNLSVAAKHVRCFPGVDA
jgi:iron(III) transport system ATP-binding protein